MEKLLGGNSIWRLVPVWIEIERWWGACFFELGKVVEGRSWPKCIHGLNDLERLHPVRLGARTLPDYCGHKNLFSNQPSQGIGSTMFSGCMFQRTVTETNVAPTWLGRNTLPHLTTGQLGCFMSHFTIWHYMVSWPHQRAVGRRTVCFS